MLPTLNDSQQDDNDEEEESDVKQDTVNFVIVSVWWANLVTYSTACSHTLVKMEHEALQAKINHVKFLKINLKF